jgi:hypothetical protein
MCSELKILQNSFVFVLIHMKILNNQLRIESNVLETC